MPGGSADERAETMAELEVMAHEQLTAAITGDLLDEAEADAGATLGAWQAANLREMRAAYDEATAMPVDLVAALTRATAKSELVWREARPASDFAMQQPPLLEVVRLSREAAGAKAERFGCSAYEAMLRGYERGLPLAQVQSVLDDLAEAVPPILEAALERQARLPARRNPQRPLTVPQQKALIEALMDRLGFDFSRGRLDESAHPFCGGTAQDIRITTRFDDAGFLSTLMAVLHETGHALYESGRPQDWLSQPVSAARGMALHESQSLLIEMQACRSPGFVRYLSSVFQSFDPDEPAYSAEALWRVYSHVERGLIRVDADEITYPLHVVLRFRLEQALIAGDLEVADLPAAWREGMASLLGVTPGSDREGVLQDIHWPLGLFGYFPCYTLGAIIAAQLFEAACQAYADIPEALERGDFTALNGWLGANIHALGSKLSTSELIERASGRPLSSAPFLAHLRTRYLA